jgi:hypothetical protein
MGPLGTIDISDFTLEDAIGSGHIGCPVVTGGPPGPDSQVPPETGALHPPQARKLA